MTTLKCSNRRAAASNLERGSPIFVLVRAKKGATQGTNFGNFPLWILRSRSFPELRDAASNIRGQMTEL